ncbi:Wzz/FepE/Etk N-terminal domain-containing protein [Vreelandella alkaliphila]|uniref:Lipopolysaccharide biosynthesis protein n=1 Tax=Vreelandella alkaliphila TaxID=272774 RepID=A0A7C9NX24_9GAMM|nr:Wzz/FepE/Etk N-terminal domain-containing protein [Halomonas alkaliphila]NDL70411.1 lipopolysaccharide biosynthesis protein [Halomonas alkaliphila]
MQNNKTSTVEDITLVEFVVLLIKQWKVMLGCMLLMIFIALLIAFLKPVKYDFTTMYSVASYETGEGVKRGLETPEEVIAKINNVFLERQRRSLLSDNVAELPFEVNVTNPRNTLLLRVTSTTEDKNLPLVERFHTGLVQAIEEDQSNLVEALKRSLESQYNAYSEALAAARSSNSERASELEAVYLEKVFLIERRISSINEGEASQLSVRSIEPVGLGKSFIIAVGLILAILFAPIAAILRIFMKKVTIAYRQKH